MPPHPTINAANTPRHIRQIHAAPTPTNIRAPTLASVRWKQLTLNEPATYMIPNAHAKNPRPYHGRPILVGYFLIVIRY